MKHDVRFPGELETLTKNKALEQTNRSQGSRMHQLAMNSQRKISVGFREATSLLRWNICRRNPGLLAEQQRRELVQAAAPRQKLVSGVRRDVGGVLYANLIEGLMI